MGVFVFNFFLIFFLFSCETKKKDDSDVLARVSEKTLTIKKAQRLNQGKPIKQRNHSKNSFGLDYQYCFIKKGIEMDIHKDSLLLQKRDVFFNNLVISSFLNQSHHSKIHISNKEILDYYNKNKESFSRETDEVFLEHYFTEKSIFSKKIKIFFYLKQKNRYKYF